MVVMFYNISQWVTIMQKIESIKVRNTKSARISYRIDQGTYDLVKSLAEENSVGVSTVARVLLIEKLTEDRPKNIKIKR